MTGDPFVDQLLAILGGAWPWLLAIGLLYALLGLRVYQRRSLEGSWDRAYVQAAREALALGIQPTVDDTVASIRAKIADRRQRR